MGTPTKLFLNWSSFTFTYGSSPTVLTITNILDVDPGFDVTQEMFYGDANLFAKAIANTQHQRTMSVTGGDVFKLFSIPFNTSGTIVAVLNDLTNGSGSGALTFTLVNAVRKSLGLQAPNNKIASAAVTFTSFSSDGTTDPMTVTQAS